MKKKVKKSLCEQTCTHPYDILLVHCFIRLYCHMTTGPFVSQASFEQGMCFSSLDFYLVGGRVSEKRYRRAYLSKWTDRIHGIQCQGFDRCETPLS